MHDLVPITVLIGFLGAGKTTLLNRLVNEPAFANGAALINEFSKVGVDHLLVEAVHDEVLLLNAGCLCCTVRGDLAKLITAGSADPHEKGLERNGASRWFARQPRKSPMKQRPVFAFVAALVGIGHVALAEAQTSGTIKAIGVENEYADVIFQIGGEYVQVEAIVTNPNTDPHNFEASPKLAKQITAAQLIVENGLRYDQWANKIISAARRPNRQVINVQRLLGLPDDTANPHLWYDPGTRLIGLLYLIVVALAVSLSAITVGAILSTALLVGPAAIALHLVKRPGLAIVLAAAIGIAATWGGILIAYDSFEWTGGHGWPVSFCIVTIIFVSYVVVAQTGFGRKPAAIRSVAVTSNVHADGAG